ncbi:TraR/DksA family transcriptional regulator [Kushneria phyllosphaerae]|uniref:Zinc finger DksA/TraR C4-type domain-containing protein n=1 Tax=Kushneria phyllosphaerae TaxID=2100822 RepID=A0A2R8CR09_9GAMM|nr:TraR/DksA family transcriptional regulator [Kushneria phyllosphaerae]SPJ35223.1 hypothetical protein KSP9073_03281 [Kushneria phyllosphaerae]
MRGPTVADNLDIAAENTQRRLDAALANRARMATTPSLTHCADCDEPIPQRRRDALPGVATCVDCQSVNEHKSKGIR